MEDKHSAVFVDVVDLVQDVGRISGRVSAVSLVCLGPLGVCESSSAGRPRGVPATDSVVRTEVTRLLEAWKQELVVLPDDSAVVPRRLRPDQSVRGPSQAPDGLCSDASSLRAWYRNVGATFQCPIRLEIDSAGAKAFCQPIATGDCGFEIVDLFVGPRHFQADAVQESDNEDSLDG